MTLLKHENLNSVLIPELNDKAEGLDSIKSLTKDSTDAVIEIVENGLKK